MAWTKIKSAIVIGGAVILAIGTTGLVVERAAQPKGPLPESSWAFKGNATPEATFQSALWAMSKGDVKTFLENLTPEYRNAYQESAGKGKSEKEVGDQLSKAAAVIGDFQIIRVETVSRGEVILHARSGRMGNGKIPLKQIDKQWKIDGNLMSEPPSKTAP